MNKEDSYNKAIELMKQGSYEEAAIELDKISGYENSEELLQECENMKLWYPIYRNLVEHSTIKGVSCITHSKEERDAIKEVVSSDVSVQEFDPMNPDITLGVFFWNTGGPDNFPVEIGDSKESAFDKLGITENMMEDIGNGYRPSYSNELERISIGRYASDNSFASLCFVRKDNTSISLSFSPDSAELEEISFYDYADHSEEAQEFEEQLQQGEEDAIDWNSQTSFDVGDIVKFGHYEQDGNAHNGSEDISWYVVASENNEYLLVSRLGLDIVEYDFGEEGELNWSDCYVRQWLQDEFYSTAFDDDEKNVILSKTLDVKDYFCETYDLVEETEDKVFLLSSDEVNMYLNDTQRLMLVSYNVKALANTHSVTTCGYYLRACYSGGNKIGWGIGNDGEIRPYDCDGPLNYYPPVAIRPAVWIKQVTK